MLLVVIRKYKKVSVGNLILNLTLKPLNSFKAAEGRKTQQAAES